MQWQSFSQHCLRLERENRKLEAKVKELETLSASYSSVADALFQDTVQTLRKEIGSKDATIDSLRGEVSALRCNLNQHKDSYEAAAVQCTSLQQQLSESDLAKQMLESDLAKMCKEITRLTAGRVIEQDVHTPNTRSTARRQETQAVGQSTTQSKSAEANLDASSDEVTYIRFPKNRPTKPLPPRSTIERNANKRRKPEAAAESFSNKRSDNHADEITLTPRKKPFPGFEKGNDSTAGTTSSRHATDTIPLFGLENHNKRLVRNADDTVLIFEEYGVVPPNARFRFRVPGGDGGRCTYVLISTLPETFIRDFADSMAHLAQTLERKNAMARWTTPAVMSYDPCLQCRAMRRGTRWTREAEGQYSCHCCTQSQLFCMSLRAREGGIIDVLPLPEAVRAMNSPKSRPTDLEYWKQRRFATPDDFIYSSSDVRSLHEDLWQS